MDQEKTGKKNSCRRLKLTSRDFSPSLQGEKFGLLALTELVSSQVRLQRGNDFTEEEIGVNTCEEGAAAAASCAGRSLPYCLGTNRMVFFTAKTAIFCQKNPVAHKSCLFTYS